jgi:tellurite methyltransferase
MMDDDRIKWDSRYACPGFFLGPAPSSFLVERIDLIKSVCPGQKALDIACGEGRNSIFLARQGFCVTGIDISAEGIAKAATRAEAERLEVEFLTADLEAYEFTGTWDLIINFNFLLRGLLPEAVAALSPGGVMVVDTILDSPSLPGEHTKAYLLQTGELKRLFADLPGSVIEYGEHPFDSVPTAKLIFRKSGAM